MYRRKRRRIRRQLPLYAFLLAMLAFLLAFALPPDVPEEDGTEPLPVRSLSSVLPPTGGRIFTDTVTRCCLLTYLNRQ